MTAPDSDLIHAEGRIGPSFVNQRTYRRRRLMDMARLLPLLGIVLLMIPLLWSAADDADPVNMSDAFVYIYVVWGGLIALSLLFTWAIRRWAQHWTTEPTGKPETPSAPHHPSEL